MKIMLFYVPCPDQITAKKLIEALLSEKLIACGNIICSESLYNWEDKPEEGAEFIAIMKTLPEKTAEAEIKISGLHPYSIPAILHWEVSCNNSYWDWVKAQLN